MFSTCKSVNDNFNKRSFFMEQSVPVSSNTFWGNPFLGPPFLKKGPRKLQKGANFFFFHSCIEYSSYNIQYKFIIKHKSKKKKKTLIGQFLE